MKTSFERLLLVVVLGAGEEDGTGRSAVMCAGEGDGPGRLAVRDTGEEDGPGRSSVTGADEEDGGNGCRGGRWAREQGRKMGPGGWR